MAYVPLPEKKAPRSLALTAKEVVWQPLSSPPLPSLRSFAYQPQGLRGQSPRNKESLRGALAPLY